jgi:cell pole-organizing protein PopZ
MPPRNPAPMDQRDVDAMMAALDTPGVAHAAPEDVLELTEQMAAPADGEASSFQTIDGQSDVFFTDAPAQPEPPPRAAEPPPRQPLPQPSMPERTILSPTTSAAVDSAFNALAQTVLVQNARTLEDLVREMLRPLLKSWLDDNLPGVVERIVRAEIERVSRGRS